MPVLSNIRGKMNKEDPKVLAKIRRRQIDQTPSPVNPQYTGEISVLQSQIDGIVQAKQFGYSGDEILERFLEVHPKKRTQIENAQRAGYTNDEILDHFVATGGVLKIPLDEKITSVYEKAANLPGVKQVRQGVGAVSGAATGIAGGLIGGVIGGVGQGLIETARLVPGGEKPSLSRIGQAAEKTALSTGGFGANIGRAGGEAAPLIIGTGHLGFLPNAALSYGFGVQGAKNMYQGYESRDEVQFLSGAAQTIMSAIGLKRTLSPRGKLGEPEVGRGLILKKKIGPPVKEPLKKAIGFDAKMQQMEVNQWNKLLNLPKSFLKKQGQWNKNAAEILAREQIKPQLGDGNRITPEAARAMQEQLQARIDPLSSAQTILLKNSGNYFSLNKLGQLAKKSLEGNKGQGVDYVRSISQIDDEIAQLKNIYADVGTAGKSGDILVPASVLHHIASKQQGLAFSGDITKSNVIKDVNFQLGMSGRQMIYNDIPELRPINGYISELVHASKAIDSRIGSQVQGSNIIGRTGARVVGAVAGSSVSGVGGGVLGTVTADKLNNVLSNPATKIDVLQNYLIQAARQPNGQELLNQAFIKVAQDAMVRAQTSQLNTGQNIIYSEAGNPVGSSSVIPQTGAQPRLGGVQLTQPRVSEARLHSHVDASINGDIKQFSETKIPTEKARYSSTPNLHRSFVEHSISDIGGRARQIDGIHGVSAYLRLALQAQEFKNIEQLREALKEALTRFTQ